MNVKDILEPLVLGWLTNSLTAPRSLKTPEAQADEMDRLVDTVVRGAPGLDADGLESWWETVVREHGARAQTRSWPTPKELIDAMGAAREALKLTVDPGARSTWALDPFKIAAGRIKRGEAVGEGWLYGSDAVALVAKGYISEAELARYREGLRRALEDDVGPDEAQRIMEEHVVRHENAVAAARNDNSHFQSGRARGIVRASLRLMSERPRVREEDDFPLEDDPDALFEPDAPTPSTHQPLSAEALETLFQARLRGDYGPVAKAIAESRLAEMAFDHGAEETELR